MDALCVLPLSAPTLSLKLLDRRIALRGGRLLLQFFDGLRKLRECSTDRLAQRVVNDGLGRGHRRRCSSRSRGGAFRFLLGRFLAGNVDGGRGFGTTTRPACSTPERKIHQPLNNRTGSTAVGSLLAKTLDERLVRLVHPPGDHVLGKTGGCFLGGFFTTGDERTSDSGYGAQHLPFGDARQDPERREDFQGTGDGAQSGCSAPLLSGGTFGFRPRAGFACTGSNA